MCCGSLLPSLLLDSTTRGLIRQSPSAWSSVEVSAEGSWSRSGYTGSATAAATQSCAIEATVLAIGSRTRGSRVVLSIVCEVEARADVQPSLCVRTEILGDVVDELLTLQLHLKRLSRVRHNEGIRRAGLSQVPRGDLCPFDIEGIRRSSSGSLVAHCSRSERMRPRVERRCSPRTNGYLRHRRRHRAGYTAQPLFWFRQTSCRGKRLYLLNGETREKSFASGVP